MRLATPRPADPFTTHRVDLTTARAEDTIAAHIRDIGLVTVDGLTSRRAVLAFASRIMTITPHRDSDPDGLTTIRHTRRHAHRAGYAGFSKGELAPHTERSGVPAPPRLMLLVCAQPADEGGESLLTDGRALHADLYTRWRQAAVMLSRPRTAFFGAGDGHATQVFTVHPGGRITLRLRQDGLARWSPVVHSYLPHLRAAASRHQHHLSLTAGQGYLLDNHRWLHARTPFSSDRQCWRALGEPRFTLPQGFAPDPAAANPPLTREAV